VAEPLPDTNRTPNDPARRAPQSHPAKHSGHAWIWFIIVLVVLGAAFYFFRQHQEAEAAAKAKAAQQVRAVPISTATSRSGPIGVYINALGTVTPVYTVTVTSRVDGEIMSVNYREGQMVNKGDLLVEIDPRPYEAALKQAEGTLAHDEALLNEARIDLNRYQEAFNRNAIAKQQLDDQNQTVLQYEGSVKNDQGTVDTAKVNLIYTKITAPITGRVGLRLVDPGNIVQGSASTPLVVITQLQPITVIFSIAEDYLPQVQKQLRTGHPMTVDALDRDQTTKLASGSLLTLDNQIDTTTGTLKLKAVFQNNDFALFPNQFVNARLLVDTHQNATLIPVAAIQRNAKGAFVYVIKPDSTASLQTVTVGTTDGSISAVQGIQSGAVVATTGFDKLQDGAKVVVRNNPPNGSGSGQNASADGTSNKGPDASTVNSTRGSAPGSSPSDSATPNSPTSSAGSHP
jgi:membrane fusion protein, multidrug efflux system